MTIPVRVLDARLAAMDRAGIDVAVLSLSTPNVFFLPAHEQAGLARRMNDAYAAAMAAHPGRIRAFASVPMDDPDAALAVPAADRQRATVKVRIAFDELDPRILPDMGVKVTFLDLEGEEVQTAGPQVGIPASAVRSQDGGDVVLVVVDGRVESRAVRLGSALGDEIEVLSGLVAGEAVVVEGPEGLAAGDRVQVQ